MEYSVSVIIASYNPAWEKLRKTVNSILLQKDISYELIICDDGSETNYFDRLKAILNGKCSYKLFSAKQNAGTVKNVFKGVEAAEGKYIKMISPGDFLYDELCLKNWIEYMKKNNLDVTFGDAVYYNMANNNLNILNIKNNPQHPYMYKNKNNIVFDQKEDYLVIGNLVLGATFLIGRELCYNYLTKIINKVIYAEDNIFRLMVFDDIKIVYYPKKILWYEYGSGISTCGSSVWKQRVLADNYSATNILLNSTGNKSFDKRYKYLMKMKFEKKNIRYLKYILFPRTALWYFIQKFNLTMTVTNADRTFFDKL